MRRIRSRNTKPEKEVRKIFRKLGWTGYRLYRKDLPGKPDLAFLGRRKAIFVHGCFWHQHSCKVGRRLPKSNQGYWIEKFQKNKKRDFENEGKLALNGWACLIIWECELKDKIELEGRINRFMAL